MQWADKYKSQVLRRDSSIRLIRIGIPVAVLLIALFLSQRPSLLYIALPIVAAAVLVILKHPYVGIFGILPITLFYWLDIQSIRETKITSILLYSALVIGIWGIDMVVNKRQVRLTYSRAILALILLCIGMIISFLIGQLPWMVFGQGAGMDAQIGQMAIFLLSAGVFLLVAHQVQELQILKIITWFFLGVAGVYIFVRTVPGLDIFSKLAINPDATGSVFWIWLVSLAFSQAAYNRKLDYRWRGLLGLLTIASIYVSVIESGNWISGWLPAMISLIVILLVVNFRLGLLAVVGGVALIFPVVKDAVSGMPNTNSEAYSYFTRVEAWKIVLQLVRENWVLGLGPANYYYYTPLIPILGNYITFNSHNQYIDLIAQVGVVGLVLYLWFFFEMFGIGWWLKSRVPEGFSRAYVYGSIGALVGMLAAGMLGDWVLPFVYNIGLNGFRASIIGWLFLGGMFALHQMYKKNPALLEDVPVANIYEPQETLQTDKG